jgi:hypothetical protein
MTTPLLLIILAAGVRPAETCTVLPARVKRIVLHVPGGPAYDRPERRWLFFEPLRTQALWKPAFGTHWIVWTDGTLWPRHPRPTEPSSYAPPLAERLGSETRCRLAAEAAPVYGQLHDGNGSSVGIEVSHSGRSTDPFPAAQIRSLAWLLRSLVEMSEGRLTLACIVGHKDLDRRPAYVSSRCERPGCAVFVDAEGRPFRRRVDPPEALFHALAAEGLLIPREAALGDGELLRAEALPARLRPAEARP